MPSRDGGTTGAVAGDNPRHSANAEGLPQGHPEPNSVSERADERGVSMQTCLFGFGNVAMSLTLTLVVILF